MSVFYEAVQRLGFEEAVTEIYSVDSQPSAVEGVVVPEPSTYAMALAGLACGGYSLFRRRRAR
jgi:hypothetical protein